jgi:adenosylhomocysteine nucleosidase
LNKKKTLIVCSLKRETQGQLDDGYDVTYTGVGKINATFHLYSKLGEIYNSYQELPKLVINYGTAGGRRILIGQLVDCTKFIQRDMDATGLGFIRGQTPFEKDVPLILESTKVKFNPIEKHYVCGSGDNFVEDIENEIDYIDVFDMEAYALVKVCNHYHVPFISFKYITDNANSLSSLGWEENCSDGIKKFKEIIGEKK